MLFVISGNPKDACIFQDPNVDVKLDRLQESQVTFWIVKDRFHVVVIVIVIDFKLGGGSVALVKKSAFSL